MEDSVELDTLKSNLKASFNRIREDINSNSKRLNQIEKERHMLINAIKSLSQEVRDLRTSLSLRTETESQMRPPMELKGSQNLRLVSPHETKGSQLEGKSETNESQNLRLTKSQTSLKQGINGSDTLESEFMRQFKQNKSEIIKYKILSTIQEQPLTCGALKTQIVDSKRYCSKASFYRYYRELKKEGFIKVVEHENQQFLILGDRLE